MARQAARQPGDRELPASRERRRELGLGRHDVRRHRLSRVELRPRRLSRGEARARPDAALRLAQGHRASAAPTPSSCRAGSRTATTCAPAPSRASRRSWRAVERVRRARRPGARHLQRLPGPARGRPAARARCCATAASSSSASTSTCASSRPTRRSPRACTAGQVLRLPIAHGEGNYFAAPEVIDAPRARAPGRLPLRRRRPAQASEAGQPERLAQQHRRHLQRRDATSSA